MLRQQIIFFTGLIACYMIIATQAYAADCKASPQMSMGTHFKPITQHKINIGQGLKVKGVILSTQGCMPIANTRIEHWQMNTEGEYIDELRAYLMSDTNGEFTFETEWPGSDVPHIHFIVHAEGYKKLIYVWIASEKTESIELKLILEPNDNQLIPASQKSDLIPLIGSI